LDIKDVMGIVIWGMREEMDALGMGEGGNGE
jgi:hypothetical protein